MKRIKPLILLILSISIIGCSTLTSTRYSRLYSITKKEEKKKIAMGGSRKIVTIKDFRLNDAYDEDIAALKEKVEKYVSGHPGLPDLTKNDLREFKVSEGLAKEQVELLLGKPDKIMTASGRDSYGSTEIWLYRINKARVFMVFIIPVSFVNESYRLYFKGDNLAGIERHFLKQVVKEEPGEGLYDTQEKK